MVNESPSGLNLHLCPFSSGDYLSFAAATPGSSFPSRNSSDAPPPVEI